MTLTTEQRRAIGVKIMRTGDCPGGLTKPQRGILTTKQKARLFMALLAARYEVS